MNEHAWALERKAYRILKYCLSTPSYDSKSINLKRAKGIYAALYLSLAVLAFPSTSVAYTTQTGPISFDQAAAEIGCNEKYTPSDPSKVCGYINGFYPGSQVLNPVWGGTWWGHCEWVYCIGNFQLSGTAVPLGNSPLQQACSSGFVYYSNTQTCQSINPAAINPAKNLGANLGPNLGACPYVFNPVNANTGNKFAAETDYESKPLTFTRYYNSQLIDPDHTIGVLWRHAFSSRLVVSLGPSVSTVFAQRSDGKTQYYSLSSGLWVGDEDEQDRLSQLPSGGWQLVTSDDVTETYDAHGVLQSITDHAGRTQSLAYSDGTAGPNGGYVLDASGSPTATTLPSGLLIRVTDTSGRALNFGYDAFFRIVRMTDPSGGIVFYGYQSNNYDSSSLLTSVTYPDGSKRIYSYNEPANTGDTSLPNALTGITDENGVRYATYQYDAQGRAIVTEHGPNLASSQIPKYSLAYNADGTTTVTDPLGTQRTYGFTTILGVAKRTSLSQLCGSCGGSSSATTYDANGNVASRTDFNGNSACYAYDLTRNLETTRVEGLAPGKACPSNLASYRPASGTVERKISTQWDATWHLPDVVAEPNKLTTYRYDAHGNLLSRNEAQTSDRTGANGISATGTGVQRTWRYSYISPTNSSPPSFNPPPTTFPCPNTGSCSSASYNASPSPSPSPGQGLPGQVMTVTGPLGDVTTYSYYTTTASDHMPGDLQSITNALGHVTTIDHYDGDGRVLQSTDPNGLVTLLTYDPRGRLLTKTRGTETTSYTYDLAGNLTGVLFPSGETYTYAYDDAHRLTDISDPDGNRVHYTLDGMGNRKQEQILDASNNVLYAHSRQFNALNQLYQDIGAVNQAATYSYDSNGNLQILQDPMGNTTQSQYDALNRLIASTAPDTGVTQLRYNGLGQLLSATDPNGLTTSYTLDAWGDPLQTSSPDTGNTVRTYDSVGNLLTAIDARNTLTRYFYDRLNRATSKGFGQLNARYNYVYDNPCGLGRLCNVQVNGVPQLTFTYDTLGHLASEVDASSGTSLTSQYTYDPQGHLSQITDPTGRTVTYGYDTRGRVNQVSTTFNNVTTLLASNLVYQPFGPVKSFAFGNGQSYSITFDQDYRVVQEASGPRVKTDTYDLDSDLSILADANLTQQSYAYDPNGRLLSGSDTRLTGWANLAWTYDKNHNRTTDTRNGTNTVYAYGSGSNRLVSLSPSVGGTQTRSYDAMGNTQAIGSSVFSYDEYGRMIAAPNTTYIYNALDQRTGKTVSGVLTSFAYGPDGQLLFETSNSNTKAYVYLNGKPLARIDNNSAIYYYHTDQLGAPQVMTDTTGATVWSARTEPFGTAAVNTSTIVNNVRLPGQYFDAETGLHYNYFRDYDPTTGRYVEFDPIGLRGGINGYTYAGGNPVSNYDPSGLRCVGDIGCWTTPNERNLLNGGSYLGYYQAACAGGDAYACFARHMAANDSFWGHAATDWLTYKLRKHANDIKQCINESGIINQIRSDLANDYANYLPSSENQARWPTVKGIEQFHWDEFAKFGLPPSTFGGTPLAPWVGPIAPGIWCPNCK
jgi:RHS repeat-associated protein